MRNFPLIRRGNDLSLTEFDFGRLLEDFFKAPFKLGLFGTTEPAIDVYEKNGKVVAKVEIPGAKPEDIKLSVDGNFLTISGEKKLENEIKKENCYRLESAYGSFQRVVELPVEVKAEGAKAVYKNGILNVELPKAEVQKRKEIKIDLN